MPTSRVLPALNAITMTINATGQQGGLLGLRLYREVKSCPFRWNTMGPYF